MIKVGSQREIKFNQELRYQRQKNYNIMDYDVVDYIFDAGERKVYKNLNFSIFVDDYCNADCKFCVAQLRYEHKKLTYKKKHIQDPDKYLKRLEDVLKVVRPLNPSVSITGGEPTISPILTDILKLVDQYGFRKRTITTNGSGLLNVVNNDIILNHLIKYGWNHLNISRAHYDDNWNKGIMRFADEKDYFSEEKLKEVLDIVNGSSLHHRLSCILLKEGIGNVEEIKRYLDRSSMLGANNFIFRELMDYDRSAVNIEKMNYCTKNKVRLNDIWEEISKCKEFVPYLNILGYYYYVELYHYHGLNLASESADLNQQYREKRNHKEVVYEMIFHNNGNLCGSWIENEEILYEYKEN